MGARACVALLPQREVGRGWLRPRKLVTAPTPAAAGAIKPGLGHEDLL